MIIALYLLITGIFIPTIAAYANALLQPIMVIVITLAGIVILLGCVGMKISSNLGATVAANIFKGVGYVGKKIIDAIGWLVKKIINLIPVVFKGSRNLFRRQCNDIVSNCLATLVTILVVVIII